MYEEPKGEVMDIKSGWKTTEFWVTVATVISSILAAFTSPGTADQIASYADKGGIWFHTVALLSAGLSAGAYAVSRALAKRK